MPKIILHLDMNSYFASVEQQANPHLRGKPVGICEHLGGIIIAPSVEAKRLGIKLGTTVWEARKLYPQIVLLPVDPDKYRTVTARFLRILMEYTSEVEKYSIDEAFVDLTPICRDFDEALLLGLEIKQRLRQEVGEWVSCSVGIGPNKLVAKIAADLDGGVILEGAKRPIGSLRDSIPYRPSGSRVQNDKNFLDRICAVRPEDIPSLYNRLALTDIPGIGHRMERALNLLGIFTLRELANYPVANLLNQFGVLGYELHQLANFDLSKFSVISATLPVPQAGEPESREWIPGQARDDKETWGYEEPKSIGHSYTLPQAVIELRDVKKLMCKLAEKIGRRLRRKMARGNIIHYFHSDKRYFGFHKQQKLAEYINDGAAIYRAAFRIFAGELPLEFPVKLMGLTVGGLRFDKPPEPLYPEYQRPVRLTEVLDRINDKYGEFVIRRGRLLDIPEEWAKDTVGFGRMKEFSV